MGFVPQIFGLCFISVLDPGFGFGSEPGPSLVRPFFVMPGRTYSNVGMLELQDEKGERRVDLEKVENRGCVQGEESVLSKSPRVSASEGQEGEGAVLPGGVGVRLSGELGVGLPGTVGVALPGGVAVGLPGGVAVGLPGGVAVGLPGGVGVGLPGEVGVGLPGVVSVEDATGTPGPAVGAPCGTHGGQQSGLRLGRKMASEEDAPPETPDRPTGRPKWASLAHPMGEIRSRSGSLDPSLSSCARRTHLSAAPNGAQCESVEHAMHSEPSHERILQAGEQQAPQRANTTYPLAAHPSTSPLPPGRPRLRSKSFRYPLFLNDSSFSHPQIN